MKKLFNNDRFYLTITILAIISSFFYLLISYSAYFLSLKYCIAELVRVICIIVLYISYKRHDKNVMKGMMGSMLMLIFILALFSVNNADFGVFYDVLGYSSIVIATVLFISHYLINNSHKSSPAKIFLNQILCVLFALVLLANFVFISIKFALPFVISAGNVCGALSSILTAMSIVCVETRLDAYRLDREAAGWTEETGYPQGYIHECEKKENK